MTLLLLGRRIACFALVARTALSRSSMEGFMVCPPSTTPSAPRLVRMSRKPAAGATVTTASCLGGALHHLVVLGGHVLPLQLAEPSPAGSGRDQRSRVLGVDVHADEVGIADHHCGFPQRGQLVAERVDIQPRSLD